MKSIEYALLAGLIGVVIITGLTKLEREKAKVPTNPLATTSQQTR